MGEHQLAASCLTLLHSGPLRHPDAGASIVPLLGGRRDDVTGLTER